MSLFRRKKVRLRSRWTGMWFVLPVVLGTFFLNVIPAVSSLALSFSEWDLLTPPTFVGLGNFYRLTRDPFAWDAMLNTITFTIGSVGLGLMASLALALVVNQRLKGIHFFRLSFFIPYVTTIIATAMVWQLMLNGKLGLINLTLRNLFGIQGPSWLKDPDWAMFSIIIVSVWQGAGYGMMIFLAGLQNIPEEFYDAAKIDGAGAWGRFWHVTLPLLSPTTFFILIMSVIGSFQVFNLIYMFTLETGAAERLRALDVWVYIIWQNAFSFFKMGYASAMAWVLFIIIALVTLFQWQYSKRWVHYN